MEHWEREEYWQPHKANGQKATVQVRGDEAYRASATYGCDRCFNNLTYLFPDCRGNLEKRKNRAFLITMIFSCPESLLWYLQIRNMVRVYLESSRFSNSVHVLGPLVVVFNVDIFPSLTDSNIFIVLSIFKQYRTVQIFPHFTPFIRKQYHLSSNKMTQEHKEP